MEIELGPVEALESGKGKAYTLPHGDEIAVFLVEGKYFALDNACPHMGGPLAEGDVTGGCVTCPWHGWQFKLENGACQGDFGEAATSYPIKIKVGKLFVELP